MQQTLRVSFDFLVGARGRRCPVTFEVTRAQRSDGLPDEHTADLVSGDFDHWDDMTDAEEAAIDEAKRIWSERAGKVA